MRVLIYLGALFFLVNSIFAQNLKIGYVDSRVIMLKVNSFKRAQARLEKEAAAEDKKVANMQKELQDLAAQLEQQKLVLSEAKRKEKEAIINKKYTEYQKYMQDVYGPQGKLAKKRSQLAAPLLKKVQVVLQKIAKKEKFDLVLDAGIGAVLYANPSLDMTQKVVNELNKKK